MVGVKKKLSEMTLDELWHLFPIIIVSSNPKFDQYYKEEEKLLVSLLPQGTIFNHIGSTSIKGIDTKPTVDILAEVPNFSDHSYYPLLLKKGYVLFHEGHDICFGKGYTESGFASRVFHLHVRAMGDNDELYFRDYLNENPAVAKDYAKLKHSLFKTYQYDRDGYTDAKGPFIRKITERAKALYQARYDRS